MAAAAALVGSAAVTRLLTRQAEAQHKRLGKLLNVGSEKLHVLDHGSGPCVVLLHGNGAMIEDYVATGLIDSLAQTNRVLAFDRPGFGESTRPAHGTWTPEREAELLAAAFAQLGVVRPVIVAHSWATLVGLALAFRDPEAVRGLVLLSGYYYPTARLDTALQTPNSLPVLGPALRNTVGPLFSYLNAPLAIKLMFAPLPVPAAFKEMYSVSMASRPSQLKSFADDTVTMPAAAQRLSERYGEIRVPIRLIAGIEDRIVDTASQSQRLNQELAGSNLQLLEGVGHMTHHARPDLVTAWVAELSDPSSDASGWKVAE